jgi:hypothetical protein
MMILPPRRLFFTPPGPTGRRVFSTRFCRVKSIDDDDDDDDDESVVAIIFQANKKRERIIKALFLSLFFNNPQFNNVHLLLNYLLSKLLGKYLRERNGEREQQQQQFNSVC